MPSLIDTSTGPIAYDETGTPGSAPPLFLLPSGAHDRHDFDELRRLLGDGLHSFALDWPSHGESPPGRGELSAMRCADVAEEVISKLAPGGAILLGNSVGGFAAARLAIRRPELIEGLVIVDGGGFGGRSPLVRVFCALMARPRFLRAVYPAFSAAYMRARTTADATARETAIATTRADPGLGAIAGLWRSFASPEHDLRREASAITAPTLLIWGRRDPVIPRRIGRRMQRLIPGSKLVVLDTGHVPHTTEPGLVAAEILSFIETVAAPASRAAAA